MKRGFVLIEALVAVLLFAVICFPLYKLYFQTGLGQQRMVRDFLAVTNVSEKILNRIDHQLEKTKKALDPLGKDVTAEVLLGLQESGDWSFLGQAFADDTGRLAIRYIPVIKSEVEFRGFSLDDSAVPSDHRTNNPQLLKAVLDSINKRSLLETVDSRWLDTEQLKHGFKLNYIRTLKPEF